MLHQQRPGSRCLSVGIVAILSNNVFIGVEERSLTDFLGEVLTTMDLLNLLSIVVHQRPVQLLRSVKVILHVGDHSGEACVLANLSDLGRVGQDVAWRNHDLSVVLLRAEVLLHVFILLHVLVGSVSRLSDMLCRLEVLLINLQITSLLSDHSPSCLLEGVSNGIVSVPAKENCILLALLHGTSSDIWRVNLNLFHVVVRDQSRCKTLTKSVSQINGHKPDENLILHLRFFWANCASLTARGAGDVKRPKRPGLFQAKIKCAKMGDWCHLRVIVSPGDLKVLLQLLLHSLVVCHLGSLLSNQLTLFYFLL